jgi:hypothetical protein
VCVPVRPLGSLISDTAERIRLILVMGMSSKRRDNLFMILIGKTVSILYINLGRTASLF